MQNAKLKIKKAGEPPPLVFLILHF